MNGYLRKLRRALAMMLAVVMLVSVAAFAEPGTMTLPSMVKSIEDEAFKGNTAIENVVIPDGATGIGRQAFADCAALQSVTIPDSVVYIGEEAFAGCEGVVIVCSSTSTAAQYAKDHGIEVRYTDAAAPELELVTEQFIRTLYVGGGFGNEILYAELSDYDPGLHGEIQWSLERADGGDVAPLYLVDNGFTAEVHHSEVPDAVGEYVYRIGAQAGDFTGSFEFTVSIENMPEDLPEDVQLVKTHYEVGETLDFGSDDIAFVGGNIASDDARVYIRCFGIEETALWQQNGGQWTEDGFRVTFAKDGRYAVPVYVFVGNMLYGGEYVITVGSGVPSDVHISWGHGTRTVFLTEGDVYFMDAFLNNFPMTEGEEIEWTVESLNGEGLAEAYTEGMWDAMGTAVWLRSMTGECGQETFVLTAHIGELSFSEQFTLTFMEKPEVLPTDDDVIIPQEEYHFEVGDTFVFMLDEIGLDETNLPEGLTWEADSYEHEYLDAHDFTWMGNGFTVTFVREGVYSFMPVVRIASGYTIGRRVKIVVGDGMADETQLHGHFPYDTIYLQGDDRCEGMLLAWVGLQDYVDCPFAEREWILEMVDHTGETPVFTASLSEEHEDCSVDLFCDGLTGETGSVTYRVGCIVDGEHEFWTEQTFHVAEMPEDLPTDGNVILENDYYELNVGDTFEFTRDMIRVEGLSEEIYWEAECHGLEEFEEVPGFEWIEDGFRVTFDKDGRYVFRAVAKLANNYFIGRDVTVIVGTGVHPDFSTRWKPNASVFYKGHNELWVGDAYLNHYVAPAGCEVEWIIEYKEEYENPPVALRLDGPWQEGNDYQARFFADQLTDDNGQASFIIRAVAGDEEIFVQEVTVETVDFTDFINADMWIESNLYTVGVGEEFRYYFNNFNLTEDSVYPEEAKVSRVIDFSGPVEWDGNVEGIDGGIRMVFHDHGFYNFQVRVRINNYTLERTIGVCVGEGAHISNDINSRYVVAEPEGNVHMGSLYLDRFMLCDWNQIDWHVDILTENPVAEFYVDNTWENGLGANIHANGFTGEAGEVTCVFTAVFDNAHTWQEEITFVVLAQDSVLPGDEDVTVPAESYELNVGDTFEFTPDMLGVSNLPEGVEWVPEYHEMEEFESSEGFEWTDGGFKITFDKEGRYVFRAVAKLAANYHIGRYITITVGSGISPDFVAEWYESGSVMFKDCGDLWVGEAYIGNYVAPAGCELEWTLEPVNAKENPNIELGFEAYSEANEYSVSVFAVQRTDETGDSTFILRATAGDETVMEQEITVSLVDFPEDMHVEMRVDETEYHVECGEEFIYNFSSFGIAEGSVWPEDAAAYKVCEPDPDLRNYWSFEWINRSGFRVEIHEPGRYAFDVRISINNYALTQTIVLFVGEGPVLEDGGMPLDLIARPEEEVWMRDFFLWNYNVFHDELSWNIEKISGGDAVQMRIDNIWEDGLNANAVAYAMTGEAGASEWRITVTDDLGYSWSRDFEVNVYPDNGMLPTDEDVQLEADLYHLNPGDTFTFRYGQIALDESKLPDYLNWLPDVHNVFFGDEEIRWIDNGFEVTLNKEGTYTFRAGAVIAANYVVARTVTVVVGDGISDDLKLINGVKFPDIYLYDEPGFGAQGCWIADMWLEGYNPNPVQPVEWSLEQIDGENVMKLSWEIFEEGCRMNIFVDSMTGLTGSASFRVICTVGDHVMTEEFTLNAVPVSEITLTDDDVILPETEYHVNPGDTLEFYYDDIGLNNADGIYWEPEFHGIDWNLEQLPGFDWIDGGIRVTFDKDGYYYFRPVAKLAPNVHIGRPVEIYVGSGISPDFAPVWTDNSFEMYKDWGDMWITDVHLRDYVAPVDTGIEWFVERLDEQENQAVELFIADVWDDGLSAGFHARQTGEPGDTTWRVYAMAGDQLICEREFTVSLTEKPEELYVSVDYQDVYYVQPGEEFVYTYADFDLSEDSVIPEGLEARKEIWTDWTLHEYTRFEGIENGFRTVFDNPGRYAFTICMAVNNVMEPVEVDIIVGEGPTLSADNESTVVFSDCVNDVWYGNYYLDNFYLRDGEEVRWEVELVTETENPVAEMYVNNTWEGGLGANIHVRNLTGETGEVTYRFTAVYGNFRWSGERTLTVIDPEDGRPENLEIEVESDVYTLNVGDTFEFTCDDFSYDESKLPEGLEGFKTIWTNEKLDRLDGFRWTEDGITVTFTEPGRYELSAVVSITLDYVLERRIQIIVGDGNIGNARIEQTYDNGVLFAGCEETIHSGWRLEGYNILTDDEVEWKLERYTDEYSPEEPIVELWISWTSDDREYVDISAGTAREQYDTEEYILTCTVNGVEVAAVTVYAPVTELPENMPTELWVECDEFHINPGDEFCFGNWMFDIADGEIPEDVEANKEIWIGGELVNDQPFEWIDEGFIVWPQNEDTYYFDAVVRIGNYHVNRTIKLVVGDGMAEEFGIDWNDNAFDMYLNHGDLWVADADIRGYAVPEGMSVEWKAELADHSGNHPVEVYVMGTWNDGLGGGFHARLLSDEPGWATYVLSAVCGEEVLFTREVTVTLHEEPENLPSEENMWVNEAIVNLNAGDAFSFTYDMFGFEEGFSEEGWNKEIYTNPLIDRQNLEWNDNGFTARFVNDGRYSFYVEMSMGNIMLTREIIIMVGSGVPQEAYLNVQQLYTVYCDGSDHLAEDVEAGYVWLEDYALLEDEEVVWTIERANGEESGPVNAYIDHVFEDMKGCILRVNDIAWEGKETFIVTAYIPQTDKSYSAELTVCVEHAPGDLPSGICVENEEFWFNVGDTLTINHGSEFADGYVPENARIEDNLWVGPENFGGEEIMWHGDGFSVTFTKEGRYVFEVAKYLNNIVYTREIAVYVGSGTTQGVEIQFEQRFDTGFPFVEEDLAHHIGGAFLAGYNPANEEQIEWTLERVSPAEGEAMPVELFIAEVHNESLNAEVFMTGVTGELGSVTYRITAKVKNGDTYSHDITYTIIEEPAGLPTYMTGVVTGVQLNPGDTYVFEGSSVGYAGGRVPEGLECYLEYFEGLEYLEYMPGFEWLEDGGFKVNFNRSGYFEFSVNYRIGTNYYLGETVRITIGEGIEGEPSLHVNRLSEDLFVEAPQGSTGLMFEVFLGGYEPYEGENMLWEIEYLEGEGGLDLQFNEIRDNDCTAALEAYVTGPETGSKTFRVHITTESGYRDWVEYTVNAVDPYDVMPGNIHFDDMELRVGETLLFYPAEHVTMEGAVPAGVMHHYIVWPDDAMFEDEGFEWLYNGENGTHDHFTFTPEITGSYDVTVELWIGNYFSRTTFKLNVTE
ncbi:MAG: leucine-rich repeat domain-containing protein [Clostridia bacterium]|nr:leucine-rich repeat domain-containing protein [Clostridia bacterium]